MIDALKKYEAHDYEIRLSIHSTLISEGVHEHEIWHELPLGQSSYGGRADMAFFYMDHFFGIEIKSARDNFSRVALQDAQYGRVFDAHCFIIDSTFKICDKGPISEITKQAKLLVFSNGCFFPTQYHSASNNNRISKISEMMRCSVLCGFPNPIVAQRLAGLLWARDAKQLGFSSLSKFIRHAAENMSIAEIRKCVRAALINRPASKWHQKFVESMKGDVAV